MIAFGGTVCSCPVKVTVMDSSSNATGQDQLCPYCNKILITGTTDHYPKRREPEPAPRNRRERRAAMARQRGGAQ